MGEWESRKVLDEADMGMYMLLQAIRLACDHDVVDMVCRALLEYEQLGVVEQILLRTMAFLSPYRDQQVQWVSPGQAEVQGVLDPLQIRFTHDAISDHFRGDHGLLDEAIENLQNGVETPGAYPPLELVRFEGRL